MNGLGGVYIEHGANNHHRASSTCTRRRDVDKNGSVRNPSTLKHSANDNNPNMIEIPTYD